MIDFEEASLIELLEEEFNTKIKDYWTPYKDIKLETGNKNCLLIKFENQDLLENKYKDLELELYSRLEKKLEEFTYYGMVALL